MDAGIVSPELAARLAMRPPPATEAFRGAATTPGTAVLNAPEPPVPELAGGIAPNPYRGRESMMVSAGAGGPMALPPENADPMLKSLQNAVLRAQGIRRREPETLVTLQEALAGDYKNLLGSSASV